MSIANKVKKFFLGVKALILIKNILQYLKDYRGKLSGIYTLQLRNGLKIKLRANTSDIRVFNDLFLRKEYPLPKNKIKLVVDIGSHIGLFALFISKKAEKIICFEPLKENFKLLKENIKINNLRNVYVYNCGLSSRTYKGKIFLPKKANRINWGAASTLPTRSEVSNKYQLAKFIKPNFIFKKFDKINYLKMDCEGCEFKILPLLDLDKVDFLVMEYHLDEKHKKIFLTKLLKNHFKKVKEKKYSKNLGIFICAK
jgi:FkbM family methyltransferase